MSSKLSNKFFFVLIIIFLNLLLLELFSFFIIKKIEPRYKSKLNLEKDSEKIKNNLIEKKYSEKIPYLRDKNQYKGLTYISLKNNRDLIFNEINNFSEKNNFNILVQGDSFGESLNFKNINTFYKDLFNKKEIGLINSSTSSYAMTPNYFQLKALINDFKLNPEIIITYYDQTDIGDDLYRYNIFLDNKQFIEYKRYDKELMSSFSQFNFNSIKIILVIKNYFLREKSRFRLSYYETFKKILRRIYLINFKKIPLQLEPLYYGININEKKKLIKLINNYINLSFKNKNLKKLYFVIHPHNNNLNNVYVMDNREILFSSIKNHKFKDKIKVISFFGKEKSFYSFVEGDIFSHPTNNYYLKKFWPKIFSEVLSSQ